MPRFSGLMKFILILSVVVLATYQQDAFSQTTPPAAAAPVPVENPELATSQDAPEDSMWSWNIFSDYITACEF